MFKDSASILLLNAIFWQFYINSRFVHKIFADYIKIYIMADDNQNS